MPLKILTLASQGKEGVGSALEIRVHRDTTLSQVPVLTKSTVLGKKASLYVKKPE